MRGMDPDELAGRAVELLRARGARVTQPRRQVIRAVASLGGHPDASEVHEAVQQEGPVHLATTYRALEQLCQAGVLQHVHLDHGQARYHLSPEVTGPEHVHAACRGCSTVTDLPTDLLADAADHLRRLGLEPDFAHTALSVVCADCAAQERSG